jgi:hypothetical protein
MNETIHRPDSRLLTPLGWWRLQWLNSLNIEGLHVQVDLFSELIGGTGLPALQVLDRLQPGVVPWKRVHSKPRGCVV